jgi:hypothetical protein
MGELSEPVRAVMDLLALGEPLGVTLLTRLADPDAVEQAEARGLVQVEADGRRLSPMVDMIPNSRRRSCTAARNDETAIMNPSTRPIVDTKPRVDAVTFPANSAENRCSKVSALGPPLVS